MLQAAQSRREQIATERTRKRQATLDLFVIGSSASVLGVTGVQVEAAIASKHVRPYRANYFCLFVCLVLFCTDLTRALPLQNNTLPCLYIGQSLRRGEILKRVLQSK